MEGEMKKGRARRKYGERMETMRMGWRDDREKDDELRRWMKRSMVHMKKK